MTDDRILGIRTKTQIIPVYQYHIGDVCETTQIFRGTIHGHPAKQEMYTTHKWLFTESALIYPELQWKGKSLILFDAQIDDGVIGFLASLVDIWVMQFVFNEWMFTKQYDYIRI